MEPKNHVFLGEGHEHAERRTWWVIWLCGAMMVLEIIGGLVFGSIALVADGLHMTTHAGALLLAALAYSYARRHANDPRFTFGTGKLGDLAGFTSAIVLAMIALLIGWEAIARLLNPVPIAFSEAIPIACLGLAVNIASAWLLSGGAHHHHGHGHEHGHGHGDGDGDGDHHGHGPEDSHEVMLADTRLILKIHEDGVPPRFRVRGAASAAELTAETIRPDGTRQQFAFARIGEVLQSIEEIPEPHAFTVNLTSGVATASVRFEEHAHADESAHRDNNMRAAVVHVMADAAVSVLVIVGLLLARTFGWLWMDPMAGIVGACVIASWAYGLVRDTGRILMDMNPDPHLTERLRREIETDGDRLTDLHVWRLGPGHLGAELTIGTSHDRRAADYHQRLRHFRTLSHVTIEVHAL
jgi:cation diffusion facilitator family transporter